MPTFAPKLLFSLSLSLVLLLPMTASAQIPFLYTNDNYWTSPHDKPVSFTQDKLGNFQGMTETGKTFTQTVVNNDLSISLQKFTIDEAYFYISDIGVIKANSDLVALSIYLSPTETA